jgi:hypothetical protein
MSKKTFKGWFGLACGMVTDYIIVICAFVEIFVILWGFSQLQKGIREEVEDLEESIDNKLALAIQSTGLAPGGEPINPVQQAIAGLIQNMALGNSNPVQKTLHQDEKGLFTKKE